MSLEQLISTYGYYAVGIGAFIEGETVLVLGGLSAHRGYLELPWVIFWAFLGSFVGDQAYFYLGRTRGVRLLESRPQWQARSEQVMALLHKHQIVFILGFRFIYGLRTVTPFLIGAAGLSAPRFFLLNFAGAVTWAVVIASMGYFFGVALESMLAELKRYEIHIFALLAAIGLAVWLVRSFAPKRY